MHETNRIHEIGKLRTENLSRFHEIEIEIGIENESNRISMPKFDNRMKSFWYNVT